MADFDHSFQKLVAEAAAACGSDRTAMERYVFGRIESMDEKTRARVLRDIDLVLKFRAPGFKEDPEQ